MLKIKLRARVGYSREAQGYTGWDEYQVWSGRKILGRYETVSQALRDYPDAEQEGPPTIKATERPEQ